MSMAELTQTRYIPREDKMEAHILQAAVTPKAHLRATIRRRSGGRDQVHLSLADDEVLQVFGTQVTNYSFYHPETSFSFSTTTNVYHSISPFTGRKEQRRKYSDIFCYLGVSI